MSNLLQTRGQHVLQETSQELEHRQRHQSITLLTAVDVITAAILERRHILRRHIDRRL